MRVRLGKAVAAAGTVLALAASAVPGNAAVLPVGSGAWASNNVTAGTGCVRIGTGGTDCLLTARSYTAVPPPARETCTNASYVVATPVIVGTDFGCRVTFQATLRLTGAGGTGTTSPGGDEAGAEVEIEVGACAGFTLGGAYLDVHDAAVGDYRVYPRVVVTNAGWKFQGNLVGIDASTQQVVVLNVAGTIVPACKRIKARRGETSVSFSGVFSGSYTFL